MNPSQHGKLNYVPIFESPSATGDRQRRLYKIFERALGSGQRRRARAILLYAAGLSAVEIARLLEVHANTIYADLHAFDTYGEVAVCRWGRGGTLSDLYGRSTRRSVAAD